MGKIRVPHLTLAFTANESVVRTTKLEHFFYIIELLFWQLLSTSKFNKCIVVPNDFHGNCGNHLGMDIEATDSYFYDRLTL